MIENQTFKAMVVSETGDNKYSREIVERKVADLPAGEVLVKVFYSSLNYKDALSASGNRGVTRRYPHTPGIDAVGVVIDSSDPRFYPGDDVMVSCYDLGMNTPGGFGQYIRVKGAWVMPIHMGLTLKEYMTYGTGGFTAAHSVYRLLKNGVKPGDGKILVTGASGGVGSFSVGILAKLGYQVVAVSGKKGEAADMLTKLGACQIIDRAAASDNSERLMLKGRWAGVIDTVGGNILATALKSTRYGGTVTCCGNAAGGELNVNVYPFILRGVSLIGIDSAACPMELRQKIWGLIASDWKLADLDSLAKVISLAELSDYIDMILTGKLAGRVVVDLLR